MKRPLKNTSDEKICLCLLEEEDLPTTLSWRNQDEIRKWFFHSEILTYEQHLEWFRSYQSSDDDYVFIIKELGSQNKPVGQLAIYHIDWENRRAEFGRLMIGELSAQGKSFAYAATNLALKIAFDQLDLREVYLEVFSDNKRALSLYEKIGFKIQSSQDSIVKMNLFRTKAD